MQKYRQFSWHPRFMFEARKMYVWHHFKITRYIYQTLNEDYED